MTNNDRFQAAMNRHDYIGAALLAVEFGAGKGSRAGAWYWADEAIKAAAKAGITLNPGNQSWPDFGDMERQINEAKKSKPSTRGAATPPPEIDYEHLLAAMC